MEPKEQIKQLHVQLEQKQNEVNNLVEQQQLLGSFKAEAMNGREKITALTAKVAALETRVTQAVKEAADATSAATATDNAVAASGKKLAAADDMARAVKVLLGL